MNNTYSPIKEDILNKNGIFPSKFTGYFAREISQNGCEIYISCYNEQHIDEVKPKLRKFLDTQYQEPDFNNIA